MSLHKVGLWEEVTLRQAHSAYWQSRVWSTAADVGIFLTSWLCLKYSMMLVACCDQQFFVVPKDGFEPLSRHRGRAFIFFCLCAHIHVCLCQTNADF